MSPPQWKMCGPAIRVKQRKKKTHTTQSTAALMCHTDALLPELSALAVAIHMRPLNTIIRNQTRTESGLSSYAAALRHGTEHPPQTRYSRIRNALRSPIRTSCKFMMRGFWEAKLLARAQLSNLRWCASRSCACASVRGLLTSRVLLAHFLFAHPGSRKQQDSTYVEYQKLRIHTR